MKKVARLLGILGGIAAVVWAMRDRLVSVAAPREPDPPRFRVVPPPAGTGQAADGDTGDDLTEIIGIGPVYAERLRRDGIDSFRALAGADAARVAEVAQVPDGRAADWIGQASGRVS